MGEFSMAITAFGGLAGVATLYAMIFRRSWPFGGSRNETVNPNEVGFIPQRCVELETFENPASALTDLTGTYAITKLKMLCFTGTHLDAHCNRKKVKSLRA